ncbi:MAG: complex I NDUFA9 subunit family protein [Chlamydiales bacterium]
MIIQGLEAILIFMNKKILIFGGSGFIGSYLTKTLLDNNCKVLIICRNIDTALNRVGNHKNLQAKNIDIFNEDEVKKLVKKCDVIVNLIGKLFEAQKGDFRKFHTIFPDILSKNVPSSKQLIHISALGIEKSAKTSVYASTKLEGQNAVINNSKNYNIVKPSIVFGEEDNFFNQFAKMAKTSPCIPLIGRGKTKFAPIYIQDLVSSIIFLIRYNKKYQNTIFEAYGPKTLSFKQLIEFVLKTTNKKRLLIVIPFPLAKLLAKLMNVFRVYRLTPDQVELLKYNNIGSKNYKNIDELIGKLGNYKKIVPKYLFTI